MPVSLFSQLFGIENEIDFNVKSFAETGAECCGDALACQHCGSESLTPSREIDKPSWADVFGSGSEACPEWYATSKLRRRQE